MNEHPGQPDMVCQTLKRCCGITELLMLLRVLSPIEGYEVDFDSLGALTQPQVTYIVMCSDSTGNSILHSTGKIQSRVL